MSEKLLIQQKRLRRQREPSQEVEVEMAVEMGMGTQVGGTETALRMPEEMVLQEAEETAQRTQVPSPKDRKAKLRRRQGMRISHLLRRCRSRLMRQQLLFLLMVPHCR